MHLSAANVGFRIASQRRSFDCNRSTRTGNSQSSTCSDVVASPGVKLYAKGGRVVHRSFTGALRTFDENFEKNHRKKSSRSKRSTSLQAISDLSVVRSQNCSVSDTSMSVVATPSKTLLGDTLLSAETPPSLRFTGRIKENSIGSSRKISRLPLVERKTSLSANVGIFNTIPQKETMLSFRDRVITRRMSDGADQSESGSNGSEDSDSRDEIYDIHRSGTGDSSSTDGELDSVPVAKRKVHLQSLPATLLSFLPFILHPYPPFLPPFLHSSLPSSKKTHTLHQQYYSSNIHLSARKDFKICDASN